LNEAWYWPAPNPDVAKVSANGLVLVPEVGDTDSQPAVGGRTDHFNAPLPVFITWMLADGMALPAFP